MATIFEDVEVPNPTTEHKEKWARRRTMLNVMDHTCWDNLQQQIRAPQMVVIGNQSSGKSSVLRDLTTLTFPVSDGLCTRFATKLSLRRSKNYTCECRIIPALTRMSADQERLRRFRGPKKDGFATMEQANLETMIKEAGRVMGVDQDESFHADVLEIRMSGPQLPHITLTDIPGIIDNPSEDQTQADVDYIRGVVEDYMKDKNVIILAVVDGSTDIQVQSVLGKIRDLQCGSRTIGVITKPDLVVGKNKISKVLRLASNENEFYKVGYGWFVVRNRTEEEEGHTRDQRDQVERELLAKSPWTGLPDKVKGRAALQSNLSEIWSSFFTQQMPIVCSELRVEITQLEAQLQAMPAAPTSPTQARQWLTNIGSRVQKGVDDLIQCCTIPSEYQRGATSTVVEAAASMSRLSGDLASSISPDQLNKVSPDSDDAMSGMNSDDHSTNDSTTISAKIEALLHRRGASTTAGFPTELVNTIISEELEPLRAQLRLFVDGLVNAFTLFLDSQIAECTDPVFTGNVQEFFTEKAAGVTRGNLVAMAPIWAWPAIDGESVSQAPSLSRNAVQVGRASRHRAWQAAVARIITSIFQIQPDGMGRFSASGLPTGGSWDFACLFEELSQGPVDLKLLVAEIVGCVEAQCEDVTREVSYAFKLERCAGTLRNVRQVFSQARVMELADGELACIFQAPPSQTEKRDMLAARKEAAEIALKLLDGLSLTDSDVRMRLEK